MKQHPFISSQFWRSEAQHGLPGSLLDITRLKPSFGWPGISRGKSAFRLIFISRIQFPAVVGRRSPLPYWLSALPGLPAAPRGCSHFLPCSPLHLQASNSTSNPSCALNLWFLFFFLLFPLLLLPLALLPLLLLQRKLSSCKGLLWLHQDHLDNFFSSKLHPITK